MPITPTTIVALATPPGRSAIAVIRLSGPASIAIVQPFLKGKQLQNQPPNTVHFGTFQHKGKIIDEVLITLFKAPHSFTKEDSIEISCHGSPFVIQKIIQLLIQQGAKPANPGEFTQRAFLNGQFDLAQAEAIADLIAADTATAHQTALHQMRGGFSTTIQNLRSSLIHCAAMMVLELDFSEEKVDFATHNQLKTLVQNIIKKINPLIKNFQLGNIIKKGLPTIITGKTNVGKSTLLNKLLGEEKALVSDIPGTTRDIIEERITLSNIDIRFIDTAGLRKATDKIEAMGIAKAQEKIKKASLILQVFDLANETLPSMQKELAKLKALDIPYLAIGNKMDKATQELKQQCVALGMILIAAKQQKNLDMLKEKIVSKVTGNHSIQEKTIIVNARHYHSLCQTNQALQQVLQGIDEQLGNELLVLDIRKALHHLGQITGEITTENLLDDIFSKFCIGK